MKSEIETYTRITVTRRDKRLRHIDDSIRYPFGLSIKFEITEEQFNELVENDGAIQLNYERSIDSDKTQDVTTTETAWLTQADLIKVVREKSIIKTIIIL